MKKTIVLAVIVGVVAGIGGRMALKGQAGPSEGDVAAVTRGGPRDGGRQRHRRGQAPGGRRPPGGRRHRDRHQRPRERRRHTRPGGGRAVQRGPKGAGRRWPAPSWSSPGHSSRSSKAGERTQVIVQARNAVEAGREALTASPGTTSSGRRTPAAASAPAKLDSLPLPLRRRPEPTGTRPSPSWPCSWRGRGPGGRTPRRPRSRWPRPSSTPPRPSWPRRG